MFGRTLAQLVQVCKQGEVDHREGDVPARQENPFPLVFGGDDVQGKKQVTPESPEQSGSESSVQSRDSFGPQQLSGDLSGRHPQGRSGRAGVVGAAKDGAGAAHLQRGHHTGHHPLLCRWGEGWTT